MKNVLMASAAVALLIIAGSVAYYFVLFLPQQQSQSQKDISAIRRAVAPTPQEQASQQTAMQKSEAQFQAQLNDYENCTMEIMQKGNAYIGQQCPNAMANITDYWKCSEKVQQSAYYQQHFTCKAPY
jgi:uncharacterized protein HemX